MSNNSETEESTYKFVVRHYIPGSPGWSHTYYTNSYDIVGPSFVKFVDHSGHEVVLSGAFTITSN